MTWKPGPTFTYGNWDRNDDGSYTSSHPKYEGMRIVVLDRDKNGEPLHWELHQFGMEPVKRNSLAEAMRYAYHEANWIAPSVREFI